MLTFNVKSAKVLFFFKDAYKLGALFSLSKNKSKKIWYDQVKRFIQLDPTVFDLSTIHDGMGIIQTLTSNNAFYHKGCSDNFSDSHYKRLVKGVQKQSSKFFLTCHKLFPTNEKKVK